MVDRERVWQQILKSSAEMQEAAEKNDWSTLNELIESRQQLLTRFFSDAVSRNQQQRLQQIRDDIQIILQQDAHTKKLTVSNKEILATGLKALNKGKQAIKSYR